MTVDEYAYLIGTTLVRAHNNKDMNTFLATFTRADQTLEQSNISPDEREKFWKDVYEIVVNSDQRRFERQSNSAFLAYMQALEREIAARIGGNTGGNSGSSGSRR